MTPIINISHLSKTYADRALPALQDVSLSIFPGEIFALLGPNGAGKSTLINILCGISGTTPGSVQVAGHDIVTGYRHVRRLVGIVPQELLVDWHHTVWRSVLFTRGLYGKPPARSYLENLLRELSLWEQKDVQIMKLSGGMKRRLMIAKALAHEPRLLFLDEPTAGVDIELRRALWRTIKSLGHTGVTIILTTHYMEEAQQIADRIGIVRKGRIILVERTGALLERLGKKTLVLRLRDRLRRVPPGLDTVRWSLSTDNLELKCSLDTGVQQTDIALLLREVSQHDICIRDIETLKSSLEEIYLGLLGEQQ